VFDMKSEFWSSFVDAGRVLIFARAFMILIVGLMAASWISRAIGKAVETRFDAQHQMLARRFSWYSLVVLVLLTTLRQLGFDLQVLLGAAGLFTVAIGFASQTSMSNLISGLFIVFERPFVVGDVIRMASGTSGEVLSIGLLSTNLRTPDNLMVRIPNESLMKSEITNLTRFPIRRYELKIAVAWNEDLKAFQEMLLGIVDRIPLCLDEPRPAVFVQSFGDVSVQVTLFVWAKSESFAEMQRLLQLEVKQAMDRLKIRTSTAVLAPV
jgi:small-conductance mechanosensitive channel